MRQTRSAAGEVLKSPGHRATTSILRCNSVMSWPSSQVCPQRRETCSEQDRPQSRGFLLKNKRKREKAVRAAEDGGEECAWAHGLLSPARCGGSGAGSLLLLLLRLPPQRRNELDVNEPVVLCRDLPTNPAPSRDNVPLPLPPTDDVDHLSITSGLER